MLPNIPQNLSDSLVRTQVDKARFADMDFGDGAGQMVLKVTIWVAL